MGAQDKAAGMPPSEIRARARAYAEGQIESQKAEFRQLGVMADWDNPDATYRTLGPHPA
jgi:isoleucyl-tRNA synthetase